MGGGNGKGRTEMAQIAHVAVAERFAAAAVVAFDSCDKARMPLTEVQKVAVLEALFLQFDGFASHLGAIEELGELLHGLRDD